MSLANLAALWFLAVSVPIIALYLFRIRRRRQEVPNLDLWRIVIQQRTTTFLLQRLRRLLSLLLQLLIMCLLVFALAKPMWSALFAQDDYLVMVIDGSASMQATEHTEGGPETRFDRALRAAEDIIRNSSEHTQIMIVAADRDLHIACPFSNDTKKLIERLARVRPTLFSTDLRLACRFAADVLEGRAKGRVLLLSDGAGPSEEELRGIIERPSATSSARKPDDSPGPSNQTSNAEDRKSPAFTYLQFGASGNNVGILNFSARKNTVRKTDEILMVVKNFSDQEKKINLEYYEGARLRKNIPLTLTPGQEVERIFSTSLPAGELLRLQLTPPDDFRHDNRAYAVVRPEKRFRLALVSPPERSFFFVQALKAMQEAVHEDSVILTPLEYAARDRNAAEIFDLTIFNGAPPPADLPPGTYLIVNTDAPEWVETQGVVSHQRVVDWDRDHPINRYLAYQNVIIGRARRVVDQIATPVTSTVLARSAETPLILLRTTDRHRVVYIGFDIQETVLPFRVAFPAMLRNILVWSHKRTAEPFRKQYATGDIIRPLYPLSGAVSERTPSTPGRAVSKIVMFKDGREVAVPLQLDGRGFFSFADTGSVAACRIDIGEESYYTAINMTHRSESAIRPSAPPSRDTRARLAAASGGFRLAGLFAASTFWMLLAACAALFVLMEWLLYHKRITE